jgi:hypothetical protein
MLDLLLVLVLLQALVLPGREWQRQHVHTQVRTLAGIKARTC